MARHSVRDHTGRFVSKHLAPRAQAARAVASLSTFLTAQSVLNRRWISKHLAGKPGADVLAQLDEERRREVEFSKRATARVTKGLAQVADVKDPAQREQQARKLLGLEARYAKLRQREMARRGLAAINRGRIRDASPEGGFWRLGVPPHESHCADMATVGFWPWVVLERFHPPVHPGCKCQLYSMADAIKNGWMKPDTRVPTPAEGLAAARRIFEQDSHVLGETFDPAEHPRGYHGEFRTKLQREVMGTIIVLSREKLQAGQKPHVTTREMSKRMGRYGQVLGHSAGALADRGLLSRVGPATYRLTRAGLDALAKDYGALGEAFREVDHPRWPRGFAGRGGQFRPKLNVQAPDVAQRFAADIADLKAVIAQGEERARTSPSVLAQPEWLQRVGKMIQDIADRHSARPVYLVALEQIRPEIDAGYEEVARLQNNAALGRASVADLEKHGVEGLAAMRDRLHAAEARVEALEERAYRLAMAQTRAEQDATLGVLEQLRPMGGNLKHQIIPHGGGATLAAESELKLAAATRLIPRDWLRLMGKMHIEIHVAGAASRELAEDPLVAEGAVRPFHKASGNWARIFLSQWTVPRVWLHELMHTLQAADAKHAALMTSRHEAEVRHLRDRTATSELARLVDLAPGYGFRRDEMAFPDEFPEVYYGKVYNRSITSAYNELLAMAMQEAWVQGGRLRRMDVGTYNWVLGLMTI